MEIQFVLVSFLNGNHCFLFELQFLSILVNENGFSNFSFRYCFSGLVISFVFVDESNLGVELRPGSGLRSFGAAGMNLRAPKETKDSLLRNQEQDQSSLNDQKVPSL